MKDTFFKKKIPMLTHLLGWTLVGTTVFVLSPLSIGVERPPLYWLKQGLTFSMLAGAFYLNYFVLVQRFLFSNKLQSFLLINLLIGLGYVALLYGYDELTNMAELMHKAFRPNVPYTPRPRNFYWDISHLLTFCLTVGIGTSISVIKKWQSDEKLRLELQQEKTNAELTYLKAQINPHFFFNTLNNIYSLTNIDVEQAKTALLKLSSMMRYVLYETEKSSSLLSKELAFIKDFIELMKMRLSSRVKLEVSIPNQVEDAEIAPMLLLPFIENCFKHGISSQADSHIFLKIVKEKDNLYLVTKNTIFNATHNTPEGKTSGIGLSNTMRRLELLYPGRFSLEIDKENAENQYRIHLKLNLK